MKNLCWWFLSLDLCRLLFFLTLSISFGYSDLLIFDCWDFLFSFIFYILRCSIPPTFCLNHMFLFHGFIVMVFLFWCWASCLTCKVSKERWWTNVGLNHMFLFNGFVVVVFVCFTFFRGGEVMSYLFDLQIEQRALMSWCSFESYVSASWFIMSILYYFRTILVFLYLKFVFSAEKPRSGTLLAW